MKTKHLLLEAKRTECAQYTLKHADLSSLERNAVKRGLSPVFVIEYASVKRSYVVIPQQMFDDLLEESRVE